MSFLNKNKSDITLSVPLDAQKAMAVKNDLVIILNALSADEINLLARAVQKPFLKSAALSELKKHI